MNTKFKKKAPTKFVAISIGFNFNSTLLLTTVCQLLPVHELLVNGLSRGKYRNIEEILSNFYSSLTE